MDIEKLNRQLARVLANFSGQADVQSIPRDGAVPDIVNDAELMKALKHAYDGLCIQTGNLGDPLTYWAEAGFPPSRSSAYGATAHEALGRAIVEYLASSGTIERRSGKDRRCRTDRRCWRRKGVTYPFMDGHGVLITADRRVRSDPRLANIATYWGVDRRSR